MFGSLPYHVSSGCGLGRALQSIKQEFVKLPALFILQVHSVEEKRDHKRCLSLYRQFFLELRLDFTEWAIVHLNRIDATGLPLYLCRRNALRMQMRRQGGNVSCFKTLQRPKCSR